MILLYQKNITLFFRHILGSFAAKLFCAFKLHYVLSDDEVIKPKICYSRNWFCYQRIVWYSTRRVYETTWRRSLLSFHSVFDNINNFSFSALSVLLTLFVVHITETVDNILLSQINNIFFSTSPFQSQPFRGIVELIRPQTNVFP